MAVKACGGYSALVFLRKHWCPGVFFSDFRVVCFCHNFVENRSGGPYKILLRLLRLFLGLCKRFFLGILGL